MSRLSIRRLAFASLLCASIGAHSITLVDSLKESENPPPGEVAETLRDAVVPHGVHVRLGGADVATFWMRKALSSARTRETNSSILSDRIEYPSVPPGVLLGLVTFDRVWLDYRDRETPAGTYTLRYAVQPAMKEHKDVSKYRDFAILTPIAFDSELDRGLPVAIAASRTALSRGHPAVLAIFPAPIGLNENAVVQNELGQPMLAARIGSLFMGLVIQGHGKTNEPI